jgi:hypothetical protein
MFVLREKEKAPMCDETRKIKLQNKYDKIKWMYHVLRKKMTLQTKREIKKKPLSSENKTVEWLSSVNEQSRDPPYTSIFVKKKKKKKN